MPRLLLHGLVPLLALVAGPWIQDGRAQSPTLAVDSTYGCVRCHAANRRAFIFGVHSERGIRCHDCHGGDPSALALPAAHRGSFLGSPSKLGTARLCSSCHSDPNRMRQFGLPEDQMAELRASRHGQLLEQGNDDAPTCTNCHDAHLILRATDARSNSHPANIPTACMRCHGDEALMAPYGLPTDQLELFRESAHGVALFDQENLAAPTCIGCHGSHAALPPGVNETADVCGRCHDLARQAFHAGPHGPAAIQGDIPGCLGCHANHSTVRVADEDFAETCTACHDADSEALELGRLLEAQVVEAASDMRGAEEAIEELARAGRDIGDVEFRYRSAHTYFSQIAQVQHSLDLEALEDLTLRVSSTTRDIREAAEAAAEHRLEHLLFLVPVWFLTLSGIVLAAFRFVELRREMREPEPE